MHLLTAPFRQLPDHEVRVPPRVTLPGTLGRRDTRGPDRPSLDDVRRNRHHDARSLHRRTDRHRPRTPVRTGEPRCASREIGCWWQPSTSLLELAPAERLVARRVLLTGRHSGAAFVAAESLVVADRLPDPTALDVDRVGASLGRLLNASGLATRRRIVEIVEVRDPAVSDRLGGTRTAHLARRTYTIASTERTLAVVTEWIVPGRLAAHIAATGLGPGHATCPTRPRPMGPAHVRRSTSDRRLAVDDVQLLRGRPTSASSRVAVLSSPAAT